VGISRLKLPNRRKQREWIPTKKSKSRFLQTAHLLGGQIGTIVPTKIQKENKMFKECYECNSDGYVREKGVYFLIDFPLLKQSYCKDCHEKLGDDFIVDRVFYR
tara:strand:- start:619 stop:930 length:312 start_codon:yes stop_codon:yes gene_type:complete